MPGGAYLFFMCCAIAESDARGYFMNFTALVEPSV